MVDADDNAFGQPPAELLPDGCDGTHNSLRQIASRRKSIAHAEYRVAPSGEGLFVHQVLEIDNFSYCFRSNYRVRKTETPYAIRISLPVA